MSYPVYGYSNGVLFAYLALILAGSLFYLSSIHLRFFNPLRLRDRLFQGSFVCFVFAEILGLSLVYGEKALLFSEILLYSPLFPLGLSLLLLFTEPKKWVLHLSDALALSLLLPPCQYAPFMAFVTFGALFYLFARALITFGYAYQELRSSFTFFSLKEALDHLSLGLVIAKRNGVVVYENPAFLALLKEFEIDPRQKEEALYKALRWKSFRVLDESRFLIVYQNHYLLVRERLRGVSREISFVNVDAEVALNEELTQANNELLKEKTYLLATLDEMKTVALTEEKKSFHALVHDSFAEEVSLIHQVLINPEVNDLKPLKELVKRGLSSVEPTYSDLEAMERFYGLLGVSFVHEGDFALCPEKELALSFVREASDNAIRHGNANVISLVSETREGSFVLLIRNNGASPKDFAPHNGLTHLRSLAEKKGGHLEVSLSPSFSLTLSLPLPKG